jgi:homoaconitase/3-isopropylmalate dehydratase large subunit
MLDKTLTPHVAGPNSVKVARMASSMAAEKIAVQKAYLLSCVNARASDIRVRLIDYSVFVFFKTMCAQ